MNGNLPSRQERVRLVSSRWFLTRWFAFLIGCFSAYPNMPGKWIGIQKVKKVFTKLFNDDDHVENSVSISVLRVWICAFICNQDIIN